MSEQAFEYGDYDLEEDVTVVPTTEALPYPDVDTNDGEHDANSVARGFTNVFGRTPEEAIAIARGWSKSGHWCGVGQCLATVRQYYGVPSGFPTAISSWDAAAHKHFSSDGADAPRGAPVYWSGGSRGAGHIAISVGGGVCLSTDWLRAGKIDYAHINDITSHWGLDYKGWAREVNTVTVWEPALSGPIATVHLHNLLPGKKNDDVLKLKKRLKEKGYTGFITSSSKFGKGTQRAYAKYQTRLGYTGKDANGIPGKTSLKKLGFRVI